MNDADKVKMTINIGGEHIELSVAFNRQDAVRKAEKAAADLFDLWRSRWAKRSDKEILAMVAYQFALYYEELVARVEDAVKAAEECDARLARIINDENALPA